MVVALDRPSPIWSKFETWIRVLNTECLHFGLLSTQWFAVNLSSKNRRSSYAESGGEKQGRKEVFARVLVIYVCSWTMINLSICGCGMTTPARNTYICTAYARLCNPLDSVFNVSVESRLRGSPATERRCKDSQTRSVYICAECVRTCARSNRILCAALYLAPPVPIVTSFSLCLTHFNS